MPPLPDGTGNKRFGPFLWCSAELVLPASPVKAAEEIELGGDVGRRPEGYEVGDILMAPIRVDGIEGASDVPSSTGDSRSSMRPSAPPGHTCIRYVTRARPRAPVLQAASRAPPRGIRAHRCSRRDPDRSRSGSTHLAGRHSLDDRQDAVESAAPVDDVGDGPERCELLRAEHAQALGDVQPAASRSRQEAENRYPTPGSVRM